MPRSRRRHHSRSRSRSNSHDRDREPKRRKVENFESPHHRRSVSSEPEAKETVESTLNDSINENVQIKDKHSNNVTDISTAQENNKTASLHKNDENDANNAYSRNNDSDASSTSAGEDCETTMDTSVVSLNASLNTSANVAQTVLRDKTTTPSSKTLTPKQLQKKLESEKKKAEKQREKDERNKQKQQERDEKQRQKQLERNAKDAKLKEEREAKQRGKDIKDKEREAKRKEKEEKDELKRKEREAKETERLKKQQEADEKNREKQKMEEKKQKAAAAFSKFFVAKNINGLKKESNVEETIINTYFMPFQVKNDMRLAPIARNRLSSEEKNTLLDTINAQDEKSLFLASVKNYSRKTGKTYDDDVVIVDCNLGEGIINNIQDKTTMKVKFFKFYENRRPAYYGTWRKRSKLISGRRPYAQDSIFNYDVDSDDEWEEEEEGEDIAGSDDEEKEPESENDYEVDDEFFVPHGHLSDDEENDEENIAPEMRKAKEKLLKNQFEEDCKKKMQRLKPRVIGCVWYNQNSNKDGAVDAALDKVLKPYAIIANGRISIKKRSEFEAIEKHKWKLEKEYMPDLLRMLHGNPYRKRKLIVEFFQYLETRNAEVIASKIGLSRTIKSVANWGKYKVEGMSQKQVGWMVNKEIIAEYNLDLTLPNKWEYCTDINAKETE